MKLNTLVFKNSQGSSQLTMISKQWTVNDNQQVVIKYRLYSRVKEDIKPRCIFLVRKVAGQSCVGYAIDNTF